MAAALFHDLSLLSSSAAGDDNSSSSSRLLLSARALELGYAAVALDHTHRGLLASSHRCRTQPLAPLSSLPLPTSAALHRRRLASPTSEPFRQYTRITLYLDSPAAAASAFAPSAARLLRSYDIVAARPLTQAAFDHLCLVPYSQQLDLISIDFSNKLPFRLKLPMLKLALQRGLHFEIAYSPFVAPDGDKYTLADAKLLVDWTKGKNLIISSAAQTATQIRGPYDVINLCSYMLGLPMNRAKAAMSINPRSLISMALRKKHFYKETIRIDRLLPHEQLDSSTFMLGDWIGWDSESCKGDMRSSEINQLEPSSNTVRRPNSPMYGVIQVSHHNPHVSVIAKPSGHPTNDKEISSQTQDNTIQPDVLMDRGLSVLPTSFDHPDAGPYKPGNNEDVLNHFIQDPSGCSVDLKSLDKHVEFEQDAMGVDATTSCRLNLILGNNVPPSSETSIKFVHSILRHGFGHSGTSLEDKSLGKTTEILDDERGKAPLAHEISACSDVCFVDRVVDQSTGIPVDIEAYNGTSNPIECASGSKDAEEPINRSIDKDVEQISKGEVDAVDMNRKYIAVEHLFQGQGISSASTYHEGSDANCESDELKESYKKTIASFHKNIAETHEEPLNSPYPINKVEISTLKLEKRTRKLRSHGLAYLPFLGFFKSAHFKRKVCRKRLGQASVRLHFNLNM